MRRRVLNGWALALGIAAFAAAPARADAPLPDIDMDSPFQVQRTTDGAGRTYMAFASRIHNRGPGILKIVGRRAATTTPEMEAKQIVLTTGSLATAVPVPEETRPAGALRFAPTNGHDHWHLLRFEDYTLLRADDLQVAAPTRKTGFCLSGLALSWACAWAHPEFLSIGSDADYDLTPNPNTRSMGLIAEGGPDDTEDRSATDVYEPSVEGQDIEITGVPSGRYCLSFVANPENRILEASYANNGASRLVDIGGTPGEKRSLSVTPTSFPDDPTCGIVPAAAGPEPAGPGTGTTPGTSPGLPAGPESAAGLTPLTRAFAARLALRGVKRTFPRARGVSRACRVIRPAKAVCATGFRSGGASYRGSVTVSQRLRAGVPHWYYRVGVTRLGRPACTRVRGACPRAVRTPALLGGAVGANPVAARRALRAPAGTPAPLHEGAAWPQEWLGAASRAQVDAYRPAAR